MLFKCDMGEKNPIFRWMFIFPRHAEIRIGPEEAHSEKVLLRCFGRSDPPCPIIGTASILSHFIFLLWGQPN